jgi:hypothetical protein
VNSLGLASLYDTVPKVIGLPGPVLSSTTITLLSTIVVGVVKFTAAVPVAELLGV